LSFLTDRKTKEIPCTGCKTPIHWPPESQLQTHLGNWAEPSLCGACKRDLTEAARVAEREALRHAAHLAAGGKPADADSDVAATDVAATDVAATDVAATDVAATDVAATDVASTDTPSDRSPNVGA
jgi:hypothetical protein